MLTQQTAEHLISKGFTLAWAILVIYWAWSARKLKATTRSEPVVLRLLVYWVPLFLAFALLGPGDWYAGSWLAERFVPKAVWIKGAGLALAIAGIALACWSRYLLGSNWSSVVKIKENHELIERGPYRYIRHPIYTGLLLAFIGTALKVGDWRGVIAVAIVLVSFLRKLRIEERWLGEQFGEKYAGYMRRTKALLPAIF